MKNNQVVVFNKQNISAWQGELYRLPADIQRYDDGIAQDREVLQGLQAPFSLVNYQLSPLESRLNGWRSELGSLQVMETMDSINHMVGHHHHHRDHHHHNMTGTILHAVSDVTRAMRMSNLRSDISKMELECVPLQRQRDHLSARMRSLNERIQFNAKKSKELFFRKQELASLVEQATQFLALLKNNPQAIFEKTQAELIAGLQNYDKQHPRNQSIPARICLQEMQRKIELIQSTVVTSYVDSRRAYQLKLSHLCGYLWQLEQQWGDKDPQFFEFIHASLQNLHMDCDGDLPDDLHFGVSCLAGFKCLQEFNPELRDMNENDLYHLEERGFQSILSDLNGLLAKMPKETQVQRDFVAHAKAVAVSISQEKYAPVKPGQPLPDMKFFTHILSETMRLVSNPVSVNVREHYKTLASQASGVPSTGKKLAAAMLLLLGSAILITSVLATVASFGVSSPFGSSGSMIGAALIVGGMGLFAHGMRKGVSKQMFNTVKMAETCRFNPIFSDAGVSGVKGFDSDAPPPYHEVLQQGNFAPSAPLESFLSPSREYVPSAPVSEWSAPVKAFS